MRVGQRSACLSAFRCRRFVGNVLAATFSRILLAIATMTGTTMADTLPRPDPFFLDQVAPMWGGVARDPQTALGIARIAIPALFGPRALDGQEPFRVEDAGDIFWVIGAVPLQTLTLPLAAPYWVAIRKLDGAVLDIGQRVRPGPITPAIPPPPAPVPR